MYTRFPPIIYSCRFVSAALSKSQGKHEFLLYFHCFLPTLCTHVLMWQSYLSHSSSSLYYIVITMNGGWKMRTTHISVSHDTTEFPARSFWFSFQIDKPSLIMSQQGTHTDSSQRKVLN